MSGPRDPHSEHTTHTPAPLRRGPLFHVVLHQPEIPNNTGNIGRTCLALGARLWLVRPLGFQINDYYLRRAGVDYWEHVDCQIVDDWPAIERALAGRTFYYFSKRAARHYADVAYQPQDVLVFGSESSGLDESTLEANRDHALRIPTRPQVRSLNLSSAAAAAMYEAVRQISPSQPEA